MFATSPASTRWLIARWDEFEKIKFLMNDAGIVKWDGAENIREEDWDEVIDVNLNDLFCCCHAVGRHMIDRKKGSIINIASMSGVIVNRPQAQASYNTSKAAVMHLTKSLASEWARHNIRVNAMAPGYMVSPMAIPYFEKYGEQWFKNTPLGRPGQPEELGPLAVFLACDASSFVTGETLVIDGEFSIW